MKIFLFQNVVEKAPYLYGYALVMVDFDVLKGTICIYNRMLKI